MGRKRKPLVRPGDKKQKTRKGLEIPVPRREDFFGPLEKAATERKAPEPPEKASS